MSIIQQVYNFYDSLSSYIGLIMPVMKKPSYFISKAVAIEAAKYYSQYLPQSDECFNDNDISNYNEIQTKNTQFKVTAEQRDNFIEILSNKIIDLPIIYDEQPYGYVVLGLSGTHHLPVLQETFNEVGIKALAFSLFLYRMEMNVHVSSHITINNKLIYFDSSIAKHFDNQNQFDVSVAPKVKLKGSLLKLLKLD